MIKRLLFWLTVSKNCKHCCLFCKCFSMCEYEFENYNDPFPWD